MNILASHISSVILMFWREVKCQFTFLAWYQNTWQLCMYLSVYIQWVRAWISKWDDSQSNLHLIPKVACSLAPTDCKGPQMHPVFIADLHAGWKLQWSFCFFSAKVTSRCSSNFALNVIGHLQTKCKLQITARVCRCSSLFIVLLYSKPFFGELGGGWRYFFKYYTLMWLWFIKL